MTHREARVRFSKLVPRLIDKAVELGFDPAIDDVKAVSGHMKQSLHYSALAIDLILYNQDGAYITDGEAYLPLAKFWELLDPNCKAGYYFRDANHFSYAPKELVGNRG